MAGYMRINGDSGQIRPSGRQRYTPMSQINVTPFVDVMLVLLVIFMITAPLLTVGIKVDLPDTKAPPITLPDEPLEVTLRRAESDPACVATGELFLQETAVQFDALVPRLVAVTANNRDVDIYVRADKAICYDRVAKVMGLLIDAGFTGTTLVHVPDHRRRN